MNILDVGHYLSIYRLREEMIIKGIIHPPENIKAFVSDFVAKLSGMPIDEEIVLENNSFFNSKGNLIATIP